MPEIGLLTDLMALTKARLSLLVIITTFVGFCMNSGEKIDWVRLFHTLLGTALVAVSAAAINQLIETNVDRLMERTKNRPLPAGRMKPMTACALGLGFAMAGFGYLGATANPISACLAAATLFIYIFIYTPLKRRTSFCIIIGAVSGAIPPVIGWTAARPTLEIGAWILFGILFLWQIPHFLSIAWMYRDEYAQAGFIMLRRNDIGGRCTARASFLFTIALAIVTLIPAALKTANFWYLPSAIVLDATMLWCAFQFLLDRNRMSARRLFFASILYLPCVLGLMVFTKV